jgi:signal transduction histidine kinase
MRWVLANGAVALGYFLMGFVVSRFFAAYGLFPAPIWLPTGIATVAAMMGRIRLLPGIFLGSVLANAILFAPPLHITLIISSTNALGPVIGALLLRRLRPANGLFTSLAGVVAFLVCTTFLSTGISAGGGALAMSLGQAFDPTQFYSTFVNWWLTDSGGALYLAPAIILWLGMEEEPAARLTATRHRFDPQDLMVWGWIALVATVLFLTPPLRGTYIRSALPFLLVVPLSWVALRMSLRSAYTLVTLVAIVATAGTVAGFGPFQNHALANPLQLVGTLVVLLAMNVLTIVALVSERHAAEAAHKVKSMFLANTSHELRTPLNAIIGYSEIIEREILGPVGTQEYGNYARIIRSSGEHLLALITDLLEMSKIEAGRLELVEARTELAALVGGAVELVAIQAGAKSIALVVDLPADQVLIDVDERAMRQVLLNLLSNAVKFTGAAGRVAVAAALGQHGELRLTVTDTGIGLSTEALQRVFRPFERVQPSVEGTGLGLSIARGLVELHGGTIELAGEIGVGAVATVTLPARRVTVHAAEARGHFSPQVAAS